MKNAQYYQENRDRLIEKARSKGTVSRADRRLTKNPKWLAEIQEASHNDFLPFLTAIEEYEIAPKLLPKEMTLLEELIVVMSSKKVTKSE